MPLNLWVVFGGWAVAFFAALASSFGAATIEDNLRLWVSGKSSMSDLDMREREREDNRIRFWTNVSKICWSIVAMPVLACLVWYGACDYLHVPNAQGFAWGIGVVTAMTTGVGLWYLVRSMSKPFSGVAWKSAASIVLGVLLVFLPSIAGLIITPDPRYVVVATVFGLFGGIVGGWTVTAIILDVIHPRQTA